MEVRFCTGCNLDKPVSEFSKKGSYADGRQKYQSKCKKCHKKYLKKHYEANQDYYKDKAKKRNKVVRQQNLVLLFEYLREHPCVDCGETNPALLEFDHLRDKENDVSVMVWNGWSWEAILDEIEKCEVRCVRCHWIVTLKRRNWTGFDLLTEDELVELGILRDSVDI